MPPDGCCIHDSSAADPVCGKAANGIKLRYYFQSAVASPCAACFAYAIAACHIVVCSVRPRELSGSSVLEHDNDCTCFACFNQAGVFDCQTPVTSASGDVRLHKAGRTLKPFDTARSFWRNIGLFLCRRGFACSTPPALLR
jgi:hypothetical protein